MNLFLQVNEPSRTKVDDVLPSDGDNSTKSRADDVKKKSKHTQRMVRQMQSKAWVKPAAPAKQTESKGKNASLSAAGSADDSGESEDDLDSEQMTYMYKQMIKHNRNVYYV